MRVLNRGEWVRCEVRNGTWIQKEGGKGREQEGGEGADGACLQLLAGSFLPSGSLWIVQRRVSQSLKTRNAEETFFFLEAYWTSVGFGGLVKKRIMCANRVLHSPRSTVILDVRLDSISGSYGGSVPQYVEHMIHAT